MSEYHQKTPPAEGEKYLTTREIADLLRMTPKNVARMIKRGEVSHMKPFGKLLVPASEIYGLMAESWVPARKPAVGGEEV